MALMNVTYDTETGDILREVNLKEGDKVIVRNSNQDVGYKKHIENALKYHRAPGELYYFVPIKTEFVGLNNPTTTRLVYLATYCEKDTMRLALPDGSPMKRSDIARVLGVDKGTASRFVKAVTPDYMEEYEDGCLYLSKNVFRRGKGCLKGKGEIFQQFYFKGIRSIYNASNGKNIKHIGYLFKLLPYINIEWNIITDKDCIFEKELEHVSSISMRDFCNMIGYRDLTKAKQLQTIIENIKFNVDGKKQRFVRFTCNKLDDKDAVIVINPNIFYAGSNEGKVQVLTVYFRTET